ncbi:MAG: hypothetical protein C5B48_10210 [Candidatus Rokuibacteriota bacterium]|nr:MAG: hypothetical protein C5B48_10210 [Candidatus Rokubacteria bacterium]
MRIIDPTLVDDVWREMTAYPMGRVEAEAQAFLGQQPHVAAFAHAMTKEQESAVQQAAFGLCFLLFKILERSVGCPFPPLREERLTEAYRAIAESLEHAPPSSPADVLRTESEPGDPTLVGYILAVFYGGSDRSADDYDEGVRASLSLLLKTLTHAVDLGTVT